MLEITTRLKVRRDVYPVEIRDRLILPFDLRQKSRLRTQLESGAEVGVILPGGEMLRGGDLLVASDGRVVEVVAQDEKVLQANCDSPFDLARAAYHLGNRHVALQIGEGWLRIANDHVLKQMLEGLGLQVTELDAPFEPEPGAYGQQAGQHSHDGHHHSHLDDAPPTHGGVIHQFGEYAGEIKPGQKQQFKYKLVAEHVHGPGCGHDHGEHGHTHGHDHKHTHD